MSAALSRSFLDIDVEMGVDNGRMLAYLAAHGEVLSKTFHDSRVVVHCRISQHFISRMENDGVVIRRDEKVDNGQAKERLLGARVGLIGRIVPPIAT